MEHEAVRLAVGQLNTQRGNSFGTTVRNSSEGTCYSSQCHEQEQFMGKIVLCRVICTRAPKTLRIGQK
eukprot:4413358-Amphidinium_carterae.1